VKDDGLHLEHIVDCIEWVRRFTIDGREAFFADRKTQDAVVRNLR